MQTFALVIAVVSTVAYHLVTKLVPAGAHRGHFSGVNWTAPALAATVVLLGLGLLLFGVGW